MMFLFLCVVCAFSVDAVVNTILSNNLLTLLGPTYAGDVSRLQHWYEADLLSTSHSRDLLVYTCDATAVLA